MRQIFLLSAALGISMLAIADQPFDIRPGLWKVTTTLDAGSGTDTLSRNSCITAEDVRNVRLLQLAGDRGRSCTSLVTRQSASTLEGKIECTTPTGVSRSQIRFTATSPTKLVARMQAVGAGSQKGIEIAITAEWSGAACPAGDEDEDLESDPD